MTGEDAAAGAGVAGGGTAGRADPAGHGAAVGAPAGGSDVRDELLALADALTAEGETPASPCPDPVNAAMIRNWTQALGEPYSRWETFAPPAMIQVWSMPGLVREKGGSVADRPLELLNEAGYTGVVATNCEQSYDRYLRHGEHLRSTMRFGGVAGPKRTALGEGYFVTWHQTWYSGDERVAEMMFRVLKFRPRTRGGPAATGGPGDGRALGNGAARNGAPGDGADGGGAAVRPAAAAGTPVTGTAGTPGGGAPAGGSARGGPAVRYPLRPAVGPDTRFFWDGVRAGELRVQRCADCGRLRHPPGPMCPHCHATRREHVVAAGRGTVHSYVVHHHPPVPGLTPPFVVALVELDEGVRMVGNLLGCPPADVRIGMPVEVFFEKKDDELTLPQWRPAGGLPPLRIELTPTFVIAGALATRDFTPVHHDTAIARAQGSKEIFLNILTTMGLVERYVLEHLPDAVLAGIGVRLGVPAYAGDALTLTGRATGPGTVEVRGAVGLGDHVVATVRLKEPV